MEAVDMDKDSSPNKPFVRSEHEQLREHFIKRAGEAPIPNPSDPVSMTVWEDYVDEMRELERQLREAGDYL
jgi:hypothetical protein